MGTVRGSVEVTRMAAAHGRSGPSRAPAVVGDGLRTGEGALPGALEKSPDRLLHMTGAAPAGSMSVP